VKYGRKWAGAAISVAAWQNNNGSKDGEAVGNPRGIARQCSHAGIVSVTASNALRAAPATPWRNASRTRGGRFPTGAAQRLDGLYLLQWAWDRGRGHGARTNAWSAPLLPSKFKKNSS